MQGHGTAEQAGRLAQVQRLATELAARVRYAQIVDRPVPPEQIAALVAAARLLQERGEPWPPLVGEVLQRVVDTMEQAGPVPSPPQADVAPAGVGPGAAVAGLTRFGNAFRRGARADPPRT